MRDLTIASDNDKWTAVQTCIHDFDRKGLNMPTRTAHARWEGTIKEGKGTLDFGNGAFKGAYSFGSRFEDGAGTNPEELLLCNGVLPRLIHGWLHA